MRDLIQEALDRAIRKMLNDSDLRIFLWDAVVRRCGVFDQDYAHNAAAYTLLERQRIGKQLLAELKSVDMEQVFRAESEYEQLFQRMKAELERRNEQHEEEFVRRILNGK